MRLKIRVVAATAAACEALLLAVSARHAAAQRPIDLGVAIGAAGSQESRETGVHFGIFAQTHQPWRGLRPGAELSYTRFPGIDGRVWVLGARLALTPAVAWPVRPYVIGGAGAYASQGRGVSPGWSGGVGASVPTRVAELSLEYRVQTYYPALSAASDRRTRRTYMPISIGVAF